MTAPWRCRFLSRCAPTFDLDIISFPDGLLTCGLDIASFPEAILPLDLEIASFMKVLGILFRGGYNFEWPDCLEANQSCSAWAMSNKVCDFTKQDCRTREIRRCHRQVQISFGRRDVGSDQPPSQSNRRSRSSSRSFGYRSDNERGIPTVFRHCRHFQRGTAFSFIDR